MKSGAEVWAVFYNLSTDGYVPKPVGRVSRVTGRGVLVGETWYSRTAHPPLFESESECQAWCDENPRVVPRAPRSNQ